LIQLPQAAFLEADVFHLPIHPPMGRLMRSAAAKSHLTFSAVSGPGFVIQFGHGDFGTRHDS
jgi:hypothetical protein